MTDINLEEENPIGVNKEIPELDRFVQDQVDKWESESAKKDKRGWFSSIWSTSSKGFFAATKFLLRCLDKLVQFVEVAIDKGPDKKATVIATLGFLYDRIVVPALPLWAKPFKSQIKTFVFTVLVSAAIDWVVEKYNEGEWKKAS